MKLVDATDWKNMQGSSDLEKKINSYLTCRFILRSNVPDDECLEEAQELIKLFKEVLCLKK